MSVIKSRILLFVLLILGGLTPFGTTGQSDEEDLESVRVWLDGLGIKYSASELETIPWIDLSGRTISDADLRRLTPLKTLTKLDLRNTSITDEGLTTLSQFVTLEVIWLDETMVSDEGVMKLTCLKNLKEVYLSDQISLDAVESLQSSMPKLSIHHNTPVGSNQAMLIAWIILGLIVAGIFLFVFYKATYIKSKGARVAFTFGIYFFLLFLILLIDAIHFVNVAIFANGRVTELVMKTSSSGDHGTSITYHPRIQFTAGDDKQYSFVSEMGSNPPSYEVDEPVEIMYDPERPSEAEIHSEGGLFAVFSYSLLMLIFSIVISSVSGALKPVYARVSRMRNPNRVLVHEWLTSLGVNKTFEELSNKHYCDIKLEGQTFNNEDLAKLKAIRNLTLLNLSKSSISDAGLVHIGKLDTLLSLNLKKTAITDDGLVHLGSLKKLEDLDLSKTNINGRGLSHLKKLSKLKDLELQNTNVDDNCIDDLAAIKTLEDVHLYNTNVTEQGARKLEAGLPEHAVWWRPSKSSDE
jgi:hypothetical protein